MAQTGNKVPRWVWYSWPLLVVVIVLVIQLTAEEQVGSRAGQRLYAQHCQNCHAEDGSGLGTLIPPLAGADYVLEGGPELACILRYGQQGKVTVNGVAYEGVMPANEELAPVEIRSILTYIRSAWGNDREGFSFAEINVALDSCQVAAP